MIRQLQKETWSPYWVGLWIGLLLTALLAFGRSLGASTAIARVGAILTGWLSPNQVADHPYFQTLLANGVLFDWRILFLVGLLAGAFFSARAVKKSSSFTPKTWEQTFGKSKLLRALGAFVGGALLLFGARIANGCTSGHAISGGAQLAVTSWVFMISLFAIGIPVSKLLYQGKK